MQKQKAIRIGAAVVAALLVLAGGLYALNSYLHREVADDYPIPPKEFVYLASSIRPGMTAVGVKAIMRGFTELTETSTTLDFKMAPNPGHSVLSCASWYCTVHLDSNQRVTSSEYNDG